MHEQENEPDNEIERMKRGVRINSHRYSSCRHPAVFNCSECQTTLQGSKRSWRSMHYLQVCMKHASLSTGHISQIGIKQQKVLHAYRALSTVSCILELVTTLDAAVT